MNFESIIRHMNEEHKANLVDLTKKFAGVDEVKNVELVSVDFEGLNLVYNDKQKLRLEFPIKADEKSLKNAIIELCMSVKKSLDYEGVKRELQEFKASFRSVCLSTLSEDGKVFCTYAPIIQTPNADYIYISEIAEHYASIKHNPHNIEVLFLEDESKAASVILRKRLRFRANAVFIERGAEFDRVYDEFERQTGGVGGIKTIRTLLDFHLIKLTYTNGSFVKGFGQAYSIDENAKITHKGGKMPHKVAQKGV